MGDQEVNPYEQQLLSVFESCDLEKKGTLDAHGLRQLCDKLELEEQGLKLIEHLLGGGSRPTDQVTFHAFRDSLLALLDQDPEMEQASTSTETASTEQEVTPKLMFGKKKYGRSSSPLNSPQEVPQEPPDGNQEDTALLENSPAVVHPKKRKTALDVHNKTPTHGSKEMFVPLGFIHDTEVLVRANVPVNKELQNAWGLSNLKHCHVEESRSWYTYDTIKTLPVHSSTVNAETVVELWERAGVQKAAILLQDLGFSLPKVNVTELTSVLKEEIFNLQSTGIEGDWSMPETLLQAMLCLCQEELHGAKASLELVLGERDKLQLSIVEANERASLLAQEVDENHAQLEKSASAQIKLLEQKHTEQMKIVVEQLGLDREQLQAKNNALGAQVKKLEEANSQQRTELSTLKVENTALTNEKECAVQNWSRIQTLYQNTLKQLRIFNSVRDELETLKSSRELDQDLQEKINEIQAANTELRDRNDELTMQLEALTIEVNTIKIKNVASIPNECIDKIAEGCDTYEKCVSSEALKTEDSAIISPPPIEISDIQPQTPVKIETDIDLLMGPFSAVPFEEQSQNDAVMTVELAEQNAELQKSLELMREEYEKCEDYWSSKVEEERIMHDQEQNALGTKYTELLSKIKEYEQEMDKSSENSDGRLSTIHERANFEQQLNDVEEECQELEAKLDETIIEHELERDTWRISKRKLLKTVQKLKRKLRNINIVNKGMEGLKTVQFEVKKLELMEQSMNKLTDRIQQERELCEAAERVREANLKEEREHVLHRLAEQLDSPQETLDGVRCCDESCNSNKRALFYAMRNQAKLMSNLQARIYEQKEELNEITAILHQTKEQHKAEVLELEKHLNNSFERARQITLKRQEQQRCLIKNDMILTDVFEENARMTKTLAAVELRCKELMQLTEKPSSSMGKVC